MTVLGLDTTSSALTLGITNFGTLERYQTWDLGRDISLYLHQHLSIFLEDQSWSDLEWIVVAQGPGSFTGTRIGVVTSRILAQQLQIPLYGISNLTAQAYAYASASPSTKPEDRIAVEIPGQRGAVYGSLYAWDHQTQHLITHQPIQCFAIDEWHRILSTQTIQHHIKPGDIQQEHICQALITVARQQWQAGEQSVWDQVLPYYGSLAATPKP